MPKFSINSDSWDINEVQKEELIRLFKKAKEEENKRPLGLILKDWSQLPPIVQIMIGEFVIRLTVQTFNNYREMVRDIMINKRESKKEK